MNPKSSKKPHINKIASNDTEKSSLLFWITMAYVIGFLLFIPFNANGPALFNGNIAQYEGPIYSAALSSAVFLAVAAIYFFFHWRLRTERDIISMAIWLVPLSYLISIVVAASHQFAINMLLINMMYVTFFLIGAYLTESKLGAAVTTIGFLVAAYVIVLYGFLNMFGNAYFKDAVMLTDIGLRLTSVFQYANAYAAFLMAVLFCCLYMLVKVHKPYWLLLNALMLVPILNSLWLTQSRGGYLLLPIILILILPFLSVVRQIALTVYLVIGALLSLSLTDRFIKIAEPFISQNSQEYAETLQVTHLVSVFNGKSFSGWGLLLLMSAIAAVLVYVSHHWVVPWLDKLLKQRSTGAGSRSVLPVVFVVVGALGALLLFTESGIAKILPGFMSNRLENINFKQHSVLERGTLYKDAIKVIEDYPVFGTGGGGWSALWEKYQNNPYIVRQAHNFFLQYIVDVGFVGFVIFMALLIWVFYRYIRFAANKEQIEQPSYSFIFYIVAISLLLHSIIDFEMSYAYLGVILFLALGGMSSVTASRTLAEEKRLFEWERWRWFYPSVVSVIAIVFLVSVIVHVRADRFYKQAYTSLQQQQPFQDSLALLDKAIDLKPYHPDYLLLKANLMDQAYEQSKDDASKKAYMDESIKLVDKVAKKEPYNRGVFEERYSHAMIMQQSEQALDVMLDGIRLFPWDTQVVDQLNPANNRSSFYERAMDLLGQLGVAAANKNDAATKKKYFDQAQALFAIVAEKQQFLTTLPEGQLAGRDFKVTTSMRLSMGQMAFADKNYAGAADVLKPAVATLNLKEATDRSAARYYLAALKKLGQSDQALYDKLIAADPKEKEEYDKLTK